MSRIGAGRERVMGWRVVRRVSIVGGGMVELWLAGCLR